MIVKKIKITIFNPRNEIDMNKLPQYRLLSLLILLLLAFSQNNILAQSCNGFPTGNVFPGNIMNYSPECAPVTAQWYVVYSRVDDNGNPNNIGFEFIWGDGVTEIIPYSSGTITYTAASKKYEITRNHTYPSTTTVCAYNPIVYLRVNGTRCTSTLQTQPVYTWDKDNAGSGVLLLNEQTTGVVVYQICEGVSKTLTFVDNTTFNCNISASPDNPNQQKRWIQFQYGTGSTTGRIPGIVVGAKQITDNTTGNLLNNLNGDGTLSAYRESVISIPSPATGSGKLTSQIIVDGSKTIGHVGKTFEITLRNWNYCNQYDDGVLPAPGVNGDKNPVTTTALIQIIDAPQAPVASNKVICNNGNTVLSATGTTGTLKWYKNVALGSVNQVGTGGTFDPSVASAMNTSPITKTTAGNYDYWVTETLGTTNCEGPATKVTLTIREALTFSPSISGNTNVCQLSTGNTYTISGGAPTSRTYGGATEYVWTPPGDWTSTASTSSTNTYTIGSSSGAKTLTATLQYSTTVSDGTRCGASKNYSVTVNPLPGGKINADSSNTAVSFASYCSSGTAKVRFNNLSGIGTGTFTIKYTNGVTTWTQAGVPLTGGAYNVGTQPAAGTTTNYTITQIVDNATNGCTTNAPNAGLLINNCTIKKREALSAPGAITGTNPVCANDVNLEYTTSSAHVFSRPVGGATRYRWQITTANGWVFNDNGTTTDHLDATDHKMQFNSGTGNVTFQARVEYATSVTPTSSNNFCASSATTKTINVSSRASATLSTTTPTICTGTKPSLTITISNGVSPFNVVYTDGTSNFSVNGITTSPYTLTHANALTTNTNFTLVSIVSTTAPNCTGSVNTTPVPVTVLALPVASISGNNTICSGSSTPITVTVTGVGPFDVVLNDGTTNINLSGINTGYLHYVSPTTTKTYSLVSVARSSSPTCVGTVNPGTVTITVNQSPSTADAGTDQSWCDPTISTNLNATAPAIGTGAWSLVSGPSVPSISNASLRNTGISITAPNWGDYTFRWTVTNGVCPASTDDVVIGFGASPSNPAAGTDANSCFPDYTLNGNTLAIGTGTWTSSGPGAATFANNHSPTSSVTVSATGVYTFTWTSASGGCPTKQDAVDITFDPKPNVSAGIDKTICASQNTISLTGTATNYNAATVFWKKEGSMTSTGFTNGNTLNDTYTPTAAEKTTGSVKLILNVSGTLACNAITVSDTMLLTIDALPVISAGSDDNACGLSYTLNGSKNIGTGTWSKISGAGTASFGNLSSPTSTVSVSIYDTYKFVWSVTNGLCTLTDTVSVRFYENPSSASAGSTINVCGLSANLAATAYTYLGGLNDNSGSTRTWAYVSGPDATPTFGTTTNPSTTVAVDNYGSYQFSWTETNGPCSKTSNVTVNFNQPPSINILPVSPVTICEGDVLALDGNPANGSGTSFTSHVWTGNTSILDNASIQKPKVKNTTAPGTYSLTYTATDNKTCSNNGNISITVNPLPLITKQPVNTTVCKNDTTSFRVSTSTLGVSYQWYDNASGTFIAIFGAINNTYSISSAATSMSGRKFFCRLTSSNGCSKFTDTITLTVNDLPTVSIPQDMAVCKGGNTSTAITATGNGLTYKWQEKKTLTWNNLADVGVYSGTSSSSLNLSSVDTIMNGYSYRCIITTSNNCSLTSAIAGLTVNALPVISTQPSNQEVCEGDDESISITASGPGITYQWQVKSGPNFVNLNDPTYSGTTSNKLTISNADLSIDNFIYRCKLVTTGSCTLNSNSVSLDVIPAPLVYADVIDVVCSNMETYSIQAALGVTASNYSSITWTSNSGGTFTNQNTTFATYNINSTDKSSGSVILTLTAQPITMSCAPTSSSMTLTIIKAPTVSAGSDQETCENNSFDLSTSSTLPSVANNSSLLWTHTGTGNLAPLNSLTPVYTPSFGETGDITLTLTAGGNGSCPSVQDIMILHITPKPSANAGTDQSTCFGVPFDLSTSLSTPDATEYKNLEWTHNGSGTWKDGNDSILLPIYIPGASDNGTTVNLTLTAYGNGSCSTPASDFMKLTVKTLPVTTPISGSSNFCVNSTQVYKVDLPSGTPLSTYTWGVQNPTNAPTITPVNNIAIFDFDANAYSSKIYVVERNNGCNGDTVFLPIHSYGNPIANAGNNVTYCTGGSVTLGGSPTASGGSGNYRYTWAPANGLDNTQIANPLANPMLTTQYTLLVTDLTSNCTSTTSSVTITVNAIPSAPSATDKSACFQSTIPSLDASGSDVKWYSDATLTTLVGTGNTFNTGKTAVGKYTYFVTQTVNGCTSPSTAVSLTIHSVPAPPAAADKTSCTGQVTPALTASGTNIKWYSDIALTSMVYSDSVFNTGKFLAGTYSYYATQTTNNCQSNSKEVKLTIYSPPASPVASDVNICNGQTIPNLTATGTNLKWYSDVALTNLIFSGSSYATGVTLDGTYTYYVTQTENGCQGPSKAVNLIINPSPTISNVTSTPQTVCNSNDATITILASGAAPLSYSINGGLSYASGNIFTGLSQGSYPVIVKNGFNCSASRTPIIISNGAAPLPPVVSSDKTYCQGESLNPMVASDRVGGTLTWYSDPNLNNPITTGSILNPNNTIGTTTYYVTETKDTCESSPVSVSITINPLPTAPTASDKIICFNESTLLTATGTSIIWYNNSLLTSQAATGSSFTPTGLTAGNYSYWVTQTLNNCQGPSKEVKLTIISLPSTPSGKDTAICQGKPVPNLTASGSIGATYSWYNDAALTSPAFVGNPFPTGKTGVGSYDYYVIQTVNGCKSSSKKINLSINLTPTKPIADDVNACVGKPIPSLTSSGTNVRWYSNQSLTTLVSTNNPFNTTKTLAGKYTYWVVQANGNCLSDADTASLYIYSIPSAPTVSDQRACYKSTIPKLNATGSANSTIKWYSTALGNALLFTGNPFNSGDSLVNTYSYYVTQTVNGCEGPESTAKLTIDPNPVFSGKTLAHESYCNMKDGKIKISASGGASELPLEYSIDNGINYQLIDSFVTLAPATYHIKVENKFNCITDGGSIVINPGGPPPAPVVTGGGTFCFGATIADFTATTSKGNGTIRWYSDPLLTTLLNTGSSYTPVKTVGVRKYYVTETVGGCEGPSSLITLTVNAIPAKPVATDTAICFGSASPLLSSTGSNVNWYSSTLLTAPNLKKSNSNTYDPSFTSVGTYNLYVTQKVNNCESPVDTVIVIIHSIPAKPTANDTAVCFGFPVPNLTSTGSNVKWYLNKNLTGLTFSGNNFATGKTAVSQYKYFVTQTVNNCQSSPDSAILTITAIPLAPFSSGVTVCEGSTVPNLTATGSNITWYSSPTLTPAIFNGNSFASGQTTAGNYVYYVTQRVSGCESPATIDTLTIKVQPVPPVVKDTGACFATTIPHLTATGNNIKWYSDPTKTTLEFSGTSFNTGKTLPGIYTYYATQSSSGCESNTIPVKLNIYDLPLVNNVVPSHEKYCNTKDGTLTVSASDPGSFPISYSKDNGATYQSSNFFNNLINGVYTITIKNTKGCIKVSNPVTINPGTNPPAPTVSPDTSYCNGQTLALMTAKGVTGGHLKWFTNAALKNAAAIDTGKFNPSNSLGVRNYYVYDSIGTCKSPASSIKITINQLPAGTTSGNTQICDDGSNAIVTFNFTGTTPYQYTFSNGSGTFNATTSNNIENISTSTQGTYKITQLTDGNGCVANNLGDSAIITVNALPTATVSGTTSICNDGTTTAPITFDLTGKQPLTLKYRIDTDTFRVDSINTSSYVLNTSRGGSYAAVMLIDDNYCQAVSLGDSAILTSNSLPYGTITGADTLCNDYTTKDTLKIELHGTGPWNVTYTRDNAIFFNLFTSDTLNPIETLDGGMYKITQIIDDNGCSAKDLGASVNSVRNQLPSGNITAADSICVGDSTQLNFNLTGKAPWFVKYTISGAPQTDSAFSSLHTIYVKPASTKTYAITQLIDANGCIKNNPGNTKLIKVNTLPIGLPAGITPLSVCDSKDGEIVVNADIPLSNPPLMYSITDTSNFVSGNTFTGLGLGLYPTLIKNRFGCIYKSDTVEIKHGLTPPRPTVYADNTWCYGVLMDSLESHTNYGSTHTSKFRWYLNPNLTDVFENNDSVIYPKADTIGSVIYYATEVVEIATDTCESLPSKVKITINPIPDQPVASDTSICYTGNAAKNPLLIASGSKILWYANADKSGGAFKFGNTLRPTDIVPGTYEYYPTQTILGCESLVDTASFIIKPQTPTPNTFDIASCEGIVAPPLRADTTLIRWYKDAFLKQFLDNGNDYYTNIFSYDKIIKTNNTYTYYATQTQLGCESSPATATLTMKEKPEMPQAPDIIVCEGSIIPALVATSGINIQWYDKDTVAFVGENDNTYVHSLDASSPAGIYSYFVSQQVNNCESDKKKVTITIKPKPVAPTLSDTVFCKGAGSSLLKATAITGATLTWYKGITNTPLQESKITTFDPGLTAIGTVTFSVKQTIDGCSSDRTFASVTIKPVPVINSTLTTNESYCGVHDGTIKITATDITPQLHYSIDSGLNYLYNKSSFDSLYSGFYQVAVKNNDECVTYGPLLEIKAGGPPPAPLAGKDTTYCAGGTLKKLTAKTSVAGSLTWYNDISLSGASILGYGTNLNPKDSIGTLNYFVTETKNGCQSPATKIIITINPIPESPVGKDTFVCDGNIVPSLTANGNHTIKWYSHSSLADSSYKATGSFYNTSKIAIGTYTYYIKQVSDKGCSSKSDTVTLKINAIPQQPNDTVINTCSGKPIPLLNVAGPKVKWYDNLSNGDLIFTGNTYDTKLTDPGTYTFGASQVVNGCESPVSLQQLNIFKTPEQPYTENKEMCQGKTIPALIADGENIKWYDSLNTNVASGATYTPTQPALPNKYKYFATQTVNGCESPFDTLFLTIFNIPAAPVANNEQVCYNKPVPDLKAVGMNIRWYLDANLNIKVADTSDFKTGKLAKGSYTYFVTQTVHNCESPHQKVTLTINNIPRFIKSTKTDETYCGMNDGTITINAMGTGSIKYSIDRDTFESSNVFNGLKKGTYYLAIMNGLGCEVEGDTIEIKAGLAPPAPSAGPEGEYCEGDKIDSIRVTQLLEGKSIMTWYDALPLTSPISHDLAIMPDTSRRGIIPYYVTETVNGCESPPTTVTLSIYKKPAAPVANNVTVCENRIIPNLKTTASNVSWYIDNTLKTIVHNTNDFNTGNITPGTYTYYVTQWDKGCEGPYTQVSLTINPVPTLAVDVAPNKEGCPPLNVNFKATVTGADKMEWFENDSLYPEYPINTVNISRKLQNKESYVKYFRIKTKASTNLGCETEAISDMTVYPKPDFNFTLAPEKACSPAHVQFISKTGGKQYQWYFHSKDSMVGSSSIVSHDYEFTPKNDSIVNIKLIATSAEYNCTDTFTKNLVLLPVAKADFQISTTSICAPDIINFTNTSQNAVKSYWSFASGMSRELNNAINLSHNYPDPRQLSIDQIELYIESKDGCNDVKDTNITIKPEVVASFTIDTAACAPITVEFAKQSKGLISSYDWDFGDGTKSNKSAPGHTFFNNTYNVINNKVTLNILSEYGCPDDTFNYIRLYPGPKADFTITPDRQYFPHDTFTFTDLTNKGPWNYLWQFGDGQESTDAGNVSHIYNHWGKKSEDYTIPVKLVTWFGKCSDTAYGSLLLFAPKPVAYFDPPQGQCVPFTINLDTLKCQFGESYLWDFGDGNTSTEPNPSHEYKYGGDYNIKLTVSAEGGTSYCYQTVNAHPKPSVNFNVEPKEIMLPDDVLKCFNLSQDVDSLYIWDFGDDSEPSNDFNPTHQYQSLGKFPISLIGISKYDCKDTLIKDSVVTVIAKGKVVYPNAFFPEMSGPNGGSSTNQNAVFKPYSEGTSEYHFEIYNRWGERIFSTDDPNKGWDGYYKGKICDQDVYVYKAWGKFLNGRTFVKAGDITLLHRKRN